MQPAIGIEAANLEPTGEVQSENSSHPKKPEEQNDTLKTVAEVEIILPFLIYYKVWCFIIEIFVFKGWRRGGSVLSEGRKTGREQMFLWPAPAGFWKWSSGQLQSVRWSISRVLCLHHSKRLRANGWVWWTMDLSSLPQQKISNRTRGITYSGIIIYYWNK